MIQPSTQALLTAEQEIALARRVHGSDQTDALVARNQLVTANLRLVALVARWFTRRYPGADYDDLCSEGMLRLLRVAALFDPERHNRFSTYAIPALVNELGKYLKRIKATPGVEAPEPADPRPGPLDTLCLAEDRADILRAIEALTPLQAFVLARRRGLCGQEPESIYAIGRSIGLSGQRINVIEWQAVQRLGRALRRGWRDKAEAQKHCA